MGSPGIWIQFYQERLQAPTKTHIEVGGAEQRHVESRADRQVHREYPETRKIGLKKSSGVISKKQGPWGRRNIAK